MGRPLREIFPGYTYHTFSRCIDSLPLMAADNIKELLVETIQHTQEIYDFQLVHIAVLGNHIHIVIRTLDKGATISQIMQHIKGNFARKYNRLHHRTGPFWNERFGSRIIEKSQNPVYYFCVLSWYLAFNAVRKKLVQDPRRYRFSSIRAYLEEDYSGPLTITRHEYFEQLGSTFKERVQRFLEFEDYYRKRYSFVMAI